MTKHYSLWLALSISLIGIFWAGWNWRNEWFSLLDRADGWRLSRSVILLVLAYWLNALGWRLILVALGEAPSSRACFWMWMTASAGRYIPGAIWPIATRVIMAWRCGVPLANASVSLYLETVLVALSSLAVGMPTIRMEGNSGMTAIQGGLVLAVCILALHPRIISAMRCIPGQIGSQMMAIIVPSWRALLLLGAYYMLFWLVLGAIFWDFCMAIEPSVKLTTCVSWFAFSFFIGLLAIFVPGGIGVREAVLFSLMSPIMTSTNAFAITVGSRVWMMAGEGISIMVAWLLRPRK